MFYGRLRAINKIFVNTRKTENFCFCFIAIFLTLALIASIVFGFQFKNKCEDSKVLCPAISSVEVESNDTSLILQIPPNAAITKIYASVTDHEGEKRRGNIQINTASGRVFTQSFVVDPANIVSTYETTLVQPLCVGEEEATALLSASAVAEILEFTIVYCPNYCEE